MIKVYASASIGNINVGFDVIGVAISPINKFILSDSVIIKKSNKFKIFNCGRFAQKLPQDQEENIIFHCWKDFCKIINKKILVEIKLEKNMPICSGLGSSSCSIVACIVGLNEICLNPLNKNDLLSLMGKLEGKFSGEIHYDNVAPSFLGGMQLIINEKNIISQNLPYFKNWFWVIAYPGIKISTSDARSILPLKYSKQDCINHSRNLAGFIHACHTKQENLALNLMKDCIAEPYRIKLLPDFVKMSNTVKKIGALSFGISGSGPTVFAVCRNKNIGIDLANWFNKNYIKNNEGFVSICKIDNLGVKITQEI